MKNITKKINAIAKHIDTEDVKDVVTMTFDIGSYLYLRHYNNFGRRSRTINAFASKGIGIAAGEAFEFSVDAVKTIKNKISK